MHFCILCRPPFFLPSTVDFDHLKAACSFLVVLPLSWAKWLTALSINSSTGVTLASWGNSTSSKFQGLEVLSLQDSLWNSTQEGSTRVTQATLRNSASMEFQGKEVLSLRDALRCSTKGDVIATSMPYARLLTDTPTRARISFFGSWVTQFFKRPVLSYQDSYVNFLQGGLQAKVVPETDYLLRFWRSPTRVPQASLQADSPLTCCQDPKPQDPRRTRWPQEKGCWAISPDSHASHALHSYAFGYYNLSKYDVPWDWLQEACHMARVCWEAHCKGFCSEEGPHYQMEQSVRNQLECD